MAVVHHRLGGGGADQGRRGGVGAVGGVPEGRHPLLEGGLAGGEQVDQGQVGGEADRLVLVGLGAFGGRAAQVGAQPGADRGRIVGRPGVVDGGVHHR
jgi:hypothetical protein